MGRGVIDRQRGEREEDREGGKNGGESEKRGWGGK